MIAREMSTALVFDLSVCVICHISPDQAWHPHLEILESQPEICLRKNSVRTVFIALILFPVILLLYYVKQSCVQSSLAISLVPRPFDLR